MINNELETARQLRAHGAFSSQQQVKWLTNAFNSSSREPTPSSRLCGYNTHIHKAIYKHTHIYIQFKNKKEMKGK